MRRSIADPILLSTQRSEHRQPTNEVSRCERLELRVSPNREFDVAILGAGLSGLVAALHLQAAGRRVILLERREVAGGLCGTHERGGFEFVIACNDFGQGMEREMKALGVAVAFHHKKTRFHLESGIIEFPPSRRTLLRLGRNLVKQKIT